MSETVTIDYDEVISETELAILFDVCDEQVWIPKSEMHDQNEEEKTFVTTYRTAFNKGLI